MVCGSTGQLFHCSGSEPGGPGGRGVEVRVLVATGVMGEMIRGLEVTVGNAVVTGISKKLDVGEPGICVGKGVDSATQAVKNRQRSSEKTNRRFMMLYKVGRHRLQVVPFKRKTEDLVADVIDMRVSKRPAILDQFHRIKRTMTLRHKNTCAHSHPAVTSTRTMGIDPAALADRFERGPRTPLQLLDRNGKEWTVDRSQRQKAEGLSVRVCLWIMCKPHIDHQPHTQIAQMIVIPREGRSADEQIVGDA